MELRLFSCSCGYPFLPVVRERQPDISLVPFPISADDAWLPRGRARLLWRSLHAEILSSQRNAAPTAHAITSECCALCTPLFLGARDWVHRGVCASQYHKSISFIFFLSLLEMCVSFKNASCVPFCLWVTWWARGRFRRSLINATNLVY